MHKVLVTGANGLLATNVIIHLLGKGYYVKGLLRDIKKYQGPSHCNLSLITGDITDDQAMENSLKGCDSIIHTAALTSQNIRKYTPYRNINADATEKLLKLAIRHKIKKFVYISSANAFGFGTNKNPGNENMSIRPPFSDSFYALSKLEGQKRVLKYNKQLHVTVVNPTFMLGPYDGKPGSGQIILMGYRKKIVFHPPGGKNFVNVTDVAKGVTVIFEKGENGEAYILAGENLTYKEFFNKLANVTSSNSNLITVPIPVLYFIGIIGNILQKGGINTSLSLNNMKMLCTNNFYSNKKAEKELGIQFGNIETGIKQGIVWFKDHGMVK